MANMKIEQIEGIDPSYGEKLRAAEVTDTDTLLEIGCTKDGRQGLAQKTDISESQILKWVNMVDLCRIKGVGEEYSELLECAGVDTVKELRNRNPENLTTKMAEGIQPHPVFCRSSGNVPFPYYLYRLAFSASSV